MIIGSIMALIIIYTFIERQNLNLKHSSFGQMDFLGK